MNWKVFLKYCAAAAAGAAAALGIDWLRRHVYLVMVPDDDDGDGFDDFDDFDDDDFDDLDDFDESELFEEDVPDDSPEDGDFPGSGTDGDSEKIFRFDDMKDEA